MLTNILALSGDEDRRRSAVFMETLSFDGGLSLALGPPLDAKICEI
ncbi:MAG TPA: hypothetical protein VI524_14575 [Anaerolineales bacterium]|nr:hypothetical protein [Anaerolineales bacterium]